MIRGKVERIERRLGQRGPFEGAAESSEVVAVLLTMGESLGLPDRELATLNRELRSMARELGS